MDQKTSPPPQEQITGQPPQYQMHNMGSPPPDGQAQYYNMPPPGQMSPGHMSPGQQYPPGMPPQQMGSPPPQGMMPPQQQSYSLIPTPYRNLQAVSGQVWCPNCRKVVSTVTHFESGNYTHVAAFIGFWVCWLCCIPYMLDSCKDVVHKCPTCPTTFATWHRSGRTDVHVPETTMAGMPQPMH